MALPDRKKPVGPVGPAGNATLLVCLGEFGLEVGERLRAEALAGARLGDEGRGEDAPSNLVFITAAPPAENARWQPELALPPGGPIPLEPIVARCIERAGELLQLRRQLRDETQRVGPPELDVLLVAHLGCPVSRALVRPLAAALNEELRRRFAVIFPDYRGRENFHVSFVPLLASPLLTGAADGGPIRDTLLALERWHGSLDESRRFVTRCYLLQDQTTNYVLSPADLATTFTTFLAFLLLGAMRDEAEVRRFFRGPVGAGFWSTFACASLLFPAPEAHDYCANRLAIELMERLAERASQRQDDVAPPRVVRELWDPAEHLAGLDAARQLRSAREQEKVHLGKSAEPAGTFGPWEDGRAIAARYDYAWLRAEIAAAQEAQGGAEATARANSFLDALDVDEEDMVLGRHAAIRAFVDRAVSPEKNVEQLAACVGTLERVAQELRSAADAEVATLNRDLGPSPSDERVLETYRDFRRALARKPDARRMAVWGGLTGLLLGLLLAVWPPVFARVTAAGGASAAAPTARIRVVRPAAGAAEPFVTRLAVTAPYVFTVPLGLLAVFGLLWVRNALVAREIRRHLGTPRRGRAPAVAGRIREEIQAWVAGQDAAQPASPHGRSDDRAERAVAAARLRIVKATLAFAEAEIGRLRDIRRAIDVQQDLFRRRQRALGVVTTRGGEEDVSAVFPAEEELRKNLLTPLCLPRLYEKRRAIREERALVEGLIRRVWPQDWREHTPLADTAAIEAFVREQYAAVLEESVFDWPDFEADVRAHVHRFLRTFGGRLAFGLGHEGSVQPGGRGQGEEVEETVVTSREARPVVEGIIREGELGRWRVLDRATGAGRIHLVRARLGLATAGIAALAPSSGRQRERREAP